MDRQATDQNNGNYQEGDYAVGDRIKIGDVTIKIVAIDEQGQVTFEVDVPEGMVVKGEEPTA